MSKFCVQAMATLCAFAVSSDVASRADAQQTPAPPLVSQLNNGNWLPRQEAEALRDELFYQRAVYAYMTMLPALNVIGMRDGSEGQGLQHPAHLEGSDGRAYMGADTQCRRHLLHELSGLEETGPLVVAAPRDVIGMFTDFFQRTITDVGLIGPDRAARWALPAATARLRRRCAQGLFRLQISDLQRFPVLAHHHEEMRQRT